MSTLNLPKSWSRAIQEEVVAALHEDNHLQPIAAAIIGKASDDILQEIKDAITDHGLAVHVWPARVIGLHPNVPGLTMPEQMELQIDVREQARYNLTGASAYDIADYLIDLLHCSDLTDRTDGRRANLVGNKEPIQNELEDLPGLNMSVETVSVFFTVYPRCGAQPNP